jgi:hypothetical protein
MSMKMYLFVHKDLKESDTSVFSVHCIMIWGRGDRGFDFVTSLA